MCRGYCATCISGKAPPSGPKSSSRRGTKRVTGSLREAAAATAHRSSYEGGTVTIGDEDDAAVAAVFFPALPADSIVVDDTFRGGGKCRDDVVLVVLMVRSRLSSAGCVALGMKCMESPKPDRTRLPTATPSLAVTTARKHKCHSVLAIILIRDEQAINLYAVVLSPTVRDASRRCPRSGATFLALAD
jgi:hypothetical protein